MAYIPVSQRGGSTSPRRRYVPVSERKERTATKIGGIEPFGSAITAQSTSMTLKPGTAVPFDILKTVGKEVAQGSARAWSAVGTSITSAIGEKGFGLPKQEYVDPDTFLGSKKAGRVVFGKDTPFSARSEEVELYEAFGVDPQVAKDSGKGLTFALTALDLTGWGGGAKGLKGFMKAVKVAKTIEEAAALARKAGFAEDIIEQYAPIFAKANTTKSVQESVQAAMKLQNETKPRGYVPVAERAASNATSNVEGAAKIATPELIAEARKYKSAEEFVKAQGETLYHGTLAEGARDIGRNGLKIQNNGNAGSGVSLSSNKNISSIFSGKKGEILETVISPQAKLMPGEQFDKIISDLVRNKKMPYTTKQDQAIVDSLAAKQAKKQGYDGVDWRGQEEGFESLSDEVRVWNMDKVKTKSQLTDIWKKAVELPELPKISQQSRRTTQAVDIDKRIQTSPKMVTQTAREDNLLKRKLKFEETAARRGAAAGQKVGKAEAENIAQTKLNKAVRKEELKGLKQGIEIRSKKDAIINTLRNSEESGDRIRKLITEHVKESLDMADRGKAITLVKNAKTRRDLVKAFSRINRIAEDTIKKNLRNEAIDLRKKILNSDSIAIDYKARLNELLGDFELKGHKESTLDRLRRTQEFIQQEIAKGNDVEMPRRILNALSLLDRTPFEQITISQLQGLVAEMEMIETLGRTKFKSAEALWEAKKAKILDEVELQKATPLEKHELIRPAIGERLTATQKFQNVVVTAQNKASSIDKAILPMDVIFDMLDGVKGTYNGANFKFFKGQVDAGHGRYINRKTAIIDPVRELIEKHGLDVGNFERMGVVAAREQDGGIEKLIASGFSEAEVMAVKLTKEEQEVLDVMRKAMDSQFPEIQDIMRRVYNKPVEKVKNYFSFMTDWKQVDEMEIFERFGSQSPELFGMPKKNTNTGFTISRIGGAQKIKINALEIFQKHIDDTSYLIELGETTKLLGEVAASPKYGELVGEAGQLMVRNWVDVVARKGGAAGAKEIAILDTLRKNVGAAILGLKLSTILIQPTSLIDGMGFIGVKYTQNGIMNFATNAEWRKFVGNMPEIADRLGGEFALRELTEDSWLHNIQRKGFIPMQKLDQITAGMVAAGAYERKMIELGRPINFSSYDPEALAYAQLAVRRTQSSGSFKDVPLAISRGAITGNRSLDRAALQFQNFLLTRWSRIRYDAVQAGIKNKDPKVAAAIFSTVVLASLAASGARLGLNRVQDMFTGADDSSDDELLNNFVYELTGNVPFLGTATSMALYGGEMFPILDVPKGIVRGLDNAFTGKSEGAQLRGITEFLSSTGTLFGVPGMVQAESIIKDVLQEDKKSKNTNRLPKLPKLPKL